MAHTAAESQLTALGFRVRHTRMGGGIVGASRTEVVAQTPLAGNALPAGSLIRLTHRVVPVGGPPGVQVSVPNVVGVRLDKALDRLRRVGLSIRTSGLGAFVRHQSIPAGTPVPRGTTVTIRLGF